METATVTGLVPGDWTLDENKITTPRVLLTIDSASVTILPLVTISSKVDGDTVAVTATVTEGSIGADDVELTITLRDSSDTMIGVPATLH